MVVDISYPQNEEEWFAKGHLDNGVYFEIPAAFNADGTCDVAATDKRVEDFIAYLSINPQLGLGE